MSVYTQWAFGLCPHSILPPRASLDHLEFGRSDNQNMELAEQIIE